MKSVVIHHDTPSLCVNNCELCIVNCEINVNLGVAGVAGATYFLFCHIYARANVVHYYYTFPTHFLSYSLHFLLTKKVDIIWWYHK